NSEGDFIQLKDGRILFVYTHFTEGARDNAGAHLAGRYSADEGKTWTTEDVTVLENEGGMNVMSVSLFRLSDDKIALFYLRKNFESDCIPYMRTSEDEAKSWSNAIRCIPDSGYFVVNNDRVVKLNSGRIIFPTSLHKTPKTEHTNIGKIWCYYSDDDGRTWIKGNEASNPDQATTQEPGIIELKDGKLLLFCRTESGTQYYSYSSDQGVNWSTLKPSNIKSPRSPAAIERIPQTGDLMLVWNNNYNPIHDGGGKRTPFNLAISKDEGVTWEKIKQIESDPNGWYCYTAIEFVGDNVLLGHSAGDRSKNVTLGTTQITLLNLGWIYSEATPKPIIKEDSNGIVELKCADNAAKIYYSLEKKIPSILYETPIKISRTTPLWVQAVTNGKSKSELFTTFVGMNILQSALDAPGSSEQGLSYDYYEGDVSTVNNIENLTIKARGVTEKIGINNRQRDTSFAYIFKGYLTIPKDGKYTFYLASNDGSVLLIDDYEFINHDGPHGMSEESITVSLCKGKHKIVVKYFQMAEGLGLKLLWKSTEFDKVEIPEAVLSY
ncbi:MAG: exo-alpha-sialidase, partial [Melioribacteraceae bacterium]|nr:exo-alpha-sialidase [Melioribacteraceae bacterium]